MKPEKKSPAQFSSLGTLIYLDIIYLHPESKMLDGYYQVTIRYLQLLELQVIAELNFFCKIAADEKFCCSQ